MRNLIALFIILSVLFVPALCAQSDPFAALIPMPNSVPEEKTHQQEMQQLAKSDMEAYCKATDRIVNQGYAKLELMFSMRPCDSEQKFKQEILKVIKDFEVYLMEVSKVLIKVAFNELQFVKGTPESNTYLLMQDHLEAMNVMFKYWIGVLSVLNAQWEFRAIIHALYESYYDFAELSEEVDRRILKFNKNVESQNLKDLQVNESNKDQCRSMLRNAFSDIRIIAFYHIVMARCMSVRMARTGMDMTASNAALEQSAMTLLALKKQLIKKYQFQITGLE